MRVSDVILLDIDKCYPYIKSDNLNNRSDYIDFVRSVAEFGVITPVVVRRQGRKFEVIAGNWRYYAAVDIGLIEIPAVIRDMSDDEAIIVATETNLQQTGTSRFKHSELSNVIYNYHTAIKAQGKRTDIINDVYAILDEMNDITTFRPVGEKLNSAISSGRKFKVSARTVSRYLRVYQLIGNLKELLDKDVISIRTAVELSYLEDELQELIYTAIVDGKRVRAEDVSNLREIQKFNKVSIEMAGKIINNNVNNSVSGKIHNKFGAMNKVFKKYSLCRYNKRELEEILDCALYEYFKSSKTVSWYAN